MSALSKRVAQIEARFGAEAAAAWRKYHIAAQIGRLVSGVLGSVLWAATHGVTDWTALVPVAATAFWATLAEIAPQVPWLLLMSKFHLGGQPSAPAAPTSGGVGG